MVKSLLFVFVLFLIQCSDKVYESIDPNIKMISGVYFYGDFFLTGIVKEEIPAMQETHYTRYDNGIQHGEFKIVHKDGSLLLRTNYQNGMKEGPSFSWHKNGKLNTYSEFHEDKYINERMVWDANGTLVEYERYSVDGNVLVTKKWYSNGHIYMNLSFINDGSAAGLTGSKFCSPIKREENTSSL
ncbi:MAG: hypothetical protein SFU98_18555 [Leptospiraceae bacterium]|nr:hypothetical protein [Leptospiraceae bacterium]